jgi:hypothetical protein
VASAALVSPAVGMSTASADTAGTVATTSAAAAAAKAKRQIDAKIINVTRQQLQIRAHVHSYPMQWTFLQKKKCKSCTWHQVAKKKTTEHGRVFYKVGAPRTGRWYFRVGTPERKHFRTSYSDTFYTYRA